MNKKSDQRKQSIYLPTNVWVKLRFEADRTNRSLSYLIQYVLTRGGFKLIENMPTIEPWKNNDFKV